MNRGQDALARGRAWEMRAAEFLTDQGLRILAQGYRCRMGELDIIASEGAVLVIIEVRARSSSSKAKAIETIGPNKRKRIIKATRHFLMRNPTWFSRSIRFDVVSIDGIETGHPDINWQRNAFDAA